MKMRTRSKKWFLPDYMPDSSARQRKVESPGEEDKFTYIAVMMKINLPTLLCCCTWKQGMGQMLAYFPLFLEQFFSNFECSLSEFLSRKNFDILFVSGAGVTILFDLCARVPLIMSNVTKNKKI